MIIWVHKKTGLQQTSGGKDSSAWGRRSERLEALGFIKGRGILGMIIGLARLCCIPQCIQKINGTNFILSMVVDTFPETDQMLNVL